MIFSSATFLFAFLPIVISVYFVINKKFQNIWLLLASLVFYAWNNPRFLWILIASIALNFLSGMIIDYTKSKYGLNVQKITLSLVVALNLALLYYFKYFNFTIQIINDVFKSGLTSAVVLPIGISFFTFQSLSYVVDVYRGDVSVQRNPINFAMYVSMFPQLVAGPIVRYHDINEQINNRELSTHNFSTGASRFIFGLSKKILIADCLAKTADGIFNMDYSYLSTDLAWLGTIAYTLQIYFDFSGYSDMAIGLGKILGFDFIENFNYPYISRSITEFWRRWHISLSSFFRDYVYIPLGGNRKAVYRNIAIIFLLTGIWHGANYTFIVWGLWHGLFNIIERPIKKLNISNNKTMNLINHVVGRFYTLLVVMIGWVFFRSSNIVVAFDYIKSLFGIKAPDSIVFMPSYYLNRETTLVLTLAIIGSTPLIKYISSVIKRYVPDSVYLATKYLICIALLGLCMLRVASSTYSAFIYFQF